MCDKAFPAVCASCHDRLIAQHTANLLEVARAQREACALHLCPKVPHSACGDLMCEAGVVRETPLVVKESKP